MRNGMTTITRSGRLKFVGSLSIDKDLTASDWRVTVTCPLCHREHDYALSILSGVKAVDGSTVTCRCTNIGIDFGVTMSARYIRRAQKYLRRNSGQKWMALPEKKRIEPRSQRINPLPGLSPTYNTPDRLRWRHEG